MKLRQKLAVVLASAMVLTSVPVVTMAASTNSLLKETIKVSKNTVFEEVATANALKVVFKDASTNDTEVFYLELTNAEWAFGDDWTDPSTGARFHKEDKTTAKVTYKVHTVDITKAVRFPILAKATGGDATVAIVTKQGNTSISNSAPFVFATTSQKKMSYKVGDATTFYTSGELAELTVEETYQGSLENGGTIRLELADSDYSFASNKVTLTGKYGFSRYGEEEITGTISSSDSGSLTIQIPANPKGDTIGSYKITGIKVRSTNKTPEEGDFLVDIKGDDVVDTKNDVVMGKVAKYGTYIKMADDKAEDVKAGRIEEVEFRIGESVEDSMISGREFELKLTNGHFDYKGLVKAAQSANKLNDDSYSTTKADANEYSDTNYKKFATKIDAEWLGLYILSNSGDWKDYKDDAISGSTNVEAAFDVDSDGKAIVDTIIYTVGSDDKGKQVQSNEECDVLKFKLKICVPVSNKEKEKVTLTASGRALETEVSTTAINIINPFDITFEQSVLKVGLQGQVSGVVTLTEKDKDMFQKGDITFKIKKDNEDFGIYLKDVTVETAGGIKGVKDSITKGNAAEGNIKVSLNRVSKEAATLTLKDMTFTTDRTVPEGTYDLEISGTGIDADGHSITVKDFIKITTTNTQDITANGLAKGTSTFVIGESKYTFGDKEYTMDAPSYIQDPGYTMVPVRYVAQAFGVAEKDIMFGKGTVTIFAGERTVSITNGSNIAVVNGNSVAMGTAVVIKDGRTYAPASQIASLLGIKSEWDATTKTAKFTNN